MVGKYRIWKVRVIQWTGCRLSQQVEGMGIHDQRRTFVVDSLPNPLPKGQTSRVKFEIEKRSRLRSWFAISSKVNAAL